MLRSSDPPVRIAWACAPAAKHRVKSRAPPAAGRTHCAAERRSQRQPKDPQQFQDWDDIRSSLHEGEQGFVSGVLNFLSGSAFGRPDSQQEGAWPSAAGGLYRRILHSRWAGRLQSRVEQRPGSAAHGENTAQPAKQQPAAEADARPRAVGLREVALILNCSHDAAAAMARRWPGLLQLSAAELQSRLVQMKERLPNCDVSELVKQYPRGFLEPPQEAMLARLAAVSALLRAELQGADIDAMLSEDPQLLMQDPASISKGLEELHNLWAVDAKALAESDPWKLALAVRSLSPTGPPQRF